MTTIDLAKTPIHFATLDASESPLVPLEGFGFDGESFMQYIGDHCQDGPGRIFMIESSPVDWGMWECHTEGDELVIVLEGSGEFIHETAAGETRMPFAPQSALINPKGVWHTADVTAPMKALYVTPARGTEHRPR